MTAPSKQRAQRGKGARKVAKTKVTSNKAGAKKKGLKKLARKKAASVPNNKETRKKSQGRVTSPFFREKSSPRSGEESGDLQGLSNVESADSESVDELIEEGNAFEAGVISGVEEADERDEREVRTREVPEDDVPGEYLDEE